MAIAFDSISSPNQVDTATNTFAFNNVAGDTMLVFGHEGAVATSIVTGVTYNGVALTKIAEQRCDAGRMTSGWGWDSATNGACPTGSHNVVVTHSSPVSSNRYFAVSYSGSDTSGSLGASDTSVTANPAPTVSTDLTTTVDKSWMVMFGKDNAGSRTYTTSTGDTFRFNTDAGGLCLLDTGEDITPTQSNTMTITDGGTNNTARSAIAIEILPLAAGGGAIVTTPTLSLLGVG